MSLSFAHGFEALRRFELIRQHLGHTAILTDGELGELQELAGNTQFSDSGPEAEQFLGVYQRLLAGAMGRCWHSKPEPVLPNVEPGKGFVYYGTLNTILRVNVRGAGSLEMQRPETAIDPKDGFRTALAVLAGYLAGWELEFPAPKNVIDPRISASPYLAKLLGREDANRMLALYIPHWGAWGIERRHAEMGEELRLLHEQRRRLHGRTLNRPPM